MSVVSSWPYGFPRQRRDGKTTEASVGQGGGRECASGIRKARTPLGYSCATAAAGCFNILSWKLTFLTKQKCLWSKQRHWCRSFSLRRPTVGCRGCSACQVSGLLVSPPLTVSAFAAAGARMVGVSWPWAKQGGSPNSRPPQAAAPGRIKNIDSECLRLSRCEVACHWEASVVGYGGGKRAVKGCESSSGVRSLAHAIFRVTMCS